MFAEFYVGNLELPSYGVLVFVSVVWVSVIALLLAKRYGISRKNLLILEFWGGLGAILGAKLWTTAWECIRAGTISKLSWRLFRESGYSYFGAMLAGIAVLGIVSKLRHINLEQFTAAFCFLVPVLHGIWKIGCFLGGCCYGIVYDGPFAVVFPPGVKAAGVPRFPVQLLDAVILFLLAVVFYVSGRKKSPYLISKYIFIYSFFRFFTDFLRVHKTEGMMSDAQITALVCVVATVLYLARKTGFRQLLHDKLQKDTRRERE